MDNIYEDKSLKDIGSRNEEEAASTSKTIPITTKEKFIEKFGTELAIGVSAALFVALWLTLVGPLFVEKFTGLSPLISRLISDIICIPLVYGIYCFFFGKWDPGKRGKAVAMMIIIAFIIHGSQGVLAWKASSDKPSNSQQESSSTKIIIEQWWRHTETLSPMKSKKIGKIKAGDVLYSLAVDNWQTQIEGYDPDSKTGRDHSGGPVESSFYGFNGLRDFWLINPNNYPIIVYYKFK